MQLIGNAWKAGTVQVSRVSVPEVVRRAFRLLREDTSPSFGGRGKTAVAETGELASRRQRMDSLSFSSGQWRSAALPRMPVTGRRQEGAWTS